MEKERGHALPVPIGNSFFILFFTDKKFMRGAYPPKDTKTRSLTCRVRPQDGDIVKIKALSQGDFQVWPHNCPHLRALPIVKHESNVTTNLKICRLVMHHWD